jgi:hypothetical protein
MHLVLLRAGERTRHDVKASLEQPQALSDIQWLLLKNCSLQWLSGRARL